MMKEEYPYTEIEASGLAVGLPEGLMGTNFNLKLAAYTCKETLKLVI